MQIERFLKVFSTWFVLYSAAGSFVLGQFNFNDGFKENCTLSKDNQKYGVCVPLRKCQSGLQRFRNNRHQSMCWLRGYVPYVCCDPDEETTLHVGEKSRQKCWEWYPRRHQWYGGMSLVGGAPSLAQEFPHMAALGYAEGTTMKWACGGSLISDRFILTAAHCVKHKELGSVEKVRLGDLNLKSDTDDASPHDYTINRTIRHPDYKAASQYNDLALIELVEAVTFSAYIKPACLHTDKHFDRFLALIATGWGNLEFSGPPAEHLQKVYLDFVDAHVCSEYFPKGGRLAHGIDDALQICAGGEERDTCQGDSGGPLQVPNMAATGGYAIVGVTSFGKACGLTDAPGVYTRVSNYVRWIESIVWPD